MKEFIVNKELEKGYTCFLNPDKELKDKIANIEYNPNVINIQRGFRTEECIVLEKIEEEYKCQVNKDIIYLPASEVDKYRVQTNNALRNKLFTTDEYFTKTFGVIHKHFNDGLTILDIKPTEAPNPGPFNNGNTNVKFFFSAYEYKLESSKWDDLSISFGKYMRLMNLYFDEDGDFVNRDYNMDIQNFSQNKINPSIMLDRLKEECYQLKDIKYSSKTQSYYTDEYMFTPFREENKVGLYRTPAREKGGYQKYIGDTIYKRPTKLVSVSPEDVYNSMVQQLTKEELKLFSENFSEYRSL